MDFISLNNFDDKISSDCFYNERSIESVIDKLSYKPLKEGYKPNIFLVDNCVLSTDDVLSFLFKAKSYDGLDCEVLLEHLNRKLRTKSFLKKEPVFTIKSVVNEYCSFHSLISDVYHFFNLNSKKFKKTFFNFKSHNQKKKLFVSKKEPVSDGDVDLIKKRFGLYVKTVNNVRSTLERNVVGDVEDVVLDCLSDEIFSFSDKRRKLLNTGFFDNYESYLGNSFQDSEDSSDFSIFLDSSYRMHFPNGVIKKTDEELIASALILSKDYFVNILTRDSGIFHDVLSLKKGCRSSSDVSLRFLNKYFSIENHKYLEYSNISVYLFDFDLNCINSVKFVKNGFY